jgi:peptidoglycan/LPS O-acetylase OafA/YrhL
MDRTGAIPALTGVRFFAALMVFSSHYAIPGSTGAFLTFQQSGYAGVTLFFILSGFIIAYNYLNQFEKSPSSSILPFYFARFSRIYPLYAFCLIYAWMSAPSDLSILPHFLVAQAWYSDVLYAMGFNATGWSVSVEAFLYLAFPFIIPAMTYLGITKSRKKLFIAIAAITASIFFSAIYFWLSGKGALPLKDPNSAHRWLYRMPATRLMDFSLGICSAIYYMRFWKETERSSMNWSIIIYASIAASIILMGYSKNLISSFSWDAAYAIPFTLIIFGLAVSTKSKIAAFLSRPKVVLLGEASFALYLIHLLVKKLYPLNQDSLSPIAGHFTFLVIVIALSVGLHLVIEKPAQKFLRIAFKSKTKISIAEHPAK